MCVGLLQSTEGPNRTKRQREGAFLLCATTGAETPVFPSPQLRAPGEGWNPQLSAPRAFELHRQPSQVSIQLPRGRPWEVSQSAPTIP